LRVASLDAKVQLFDFDEESARIEEDVLRTARGFFWTKEFARAAFILKDCKSSKAQFLALYTKFLVSQPLG
jgi:anaphase-promoting complex subunit 8